MTALLTFSGVAPYRDMPWRDTVRHDWQLGLRMRRERPMVDRGTPGVFGPRGLIGEEPRVSRYLSD
jgi:hypothetical protein